MRSRKRNGSRLRTAVLILGSILIVQVLVVAMFLLFNRVETGTPDRLAEYLDATRNDNVNVMLTRPDNWKRIVDQPVISKEEMSIIDGRHGCH